MGGGRTVIGSDRNAIKCGNLNYTHVQGDIKKRELLKNLTKIEEIQEKRKILTEIEPLQLAF